MKSLGLLQGQLQVAADLVIWNNGGPTEMIEDFARQNSNSDFQIFVVPSPRNVGFAPGVNRAAEWSPQRAFDFIFLLNSDAQVLSPLNSEHLQEIKSLDGIVGLKVFNSADKGIRQKSARAFPSLWTALFSRQSLLAKIFPRNPWTRRYLGTDLDGSRVQKVDWVSGCALICPAPLWQALKGFDESFFFGVEDVDLGRRAQAAKKAVYFYPKVEVLHVGGVSARHRAWKSDFHHHLGMWNYFIKWTHPVGFLLSPLVFLGILLRFLSRRLFQVRTEF